MSKEIIELSEQLNKRFIEYKIVEGSKDLEMIIPHPNECRCLFVKRYENIFDNNSLFEIIECGQGCISCLTIDKCLHIIEKYLKYDFDMPKCRNLLYFLLNQR